MPLTLPVSFDHHANRGGRSAFVDRAILSGYPNVSPEPVFRYGRTFDEGIDQFRSLAQSQDCIYLCNIVGHSSVFADQYPNDFDSTLTFSYPDAETLIAAPNVVGHTVEDSLVADALAPLKDWFVICGEDSFDDSPAEAGLVAIELISPASTASGSEGVSICRLSDARKYAKNRILIDFRAYFVAPSARLDFTIVADRYRRDRLGQYFLRSNVVFGTLGDCHIDDDIAVSYRSTVFDFPATQRFFVR